MWSLWRKDRFSILQISLFFQLRHRQLNSFHETCTFLKCNHSCWFLFTTTQTLPREIIQYRKLPVSIKIELKVNAVWSLAYPHNFKEWLIPNAASEGVIPVHSILKQIIWTRLLSWLHHVENHNRYRFSVVFAFI